jgi:transmembrane sensor
MIKTPSNQIDEAAALWVARIDRGVTPEEETRLEAWLAEDPRHLGAFGRMRAVFLRTEPSVGLGRTYDPERFRPAHFWTRRSLMRAGAIAAGGAVAASTLFWLTEGEEHYATGVGETRVVALGDGSVVTLNTATSLSICYSRGVRAVKLVQGEALFDVAKETARSFVVSAGDLAVQAIGTSFTVRHLSSLPVQVLVQEGLVEVRKADVSAEKAVRLTANMRGTAAGADNIAASAIKPEEMDRELTWREGRIAFAGETLADAATKFARYSDVKIVIDDPELQRAEISGSFQANNPVGFGRAAAESLGARVSVERGQIRIFR